MWSDRETVVDALNVGHVVAAIIEILESPVVSPVTIGVFGPWGIGKSSVVRMVQRTLEAQADGGDKTLVIYFNGWRFEGYEDARSALMNAILDGIAERPTLTAKGKKLVKSLLRRVDLMALLKTGGEAIAHVKLAAFTGGLSIPLTVARAREAMADTEIGDVTEAIAKVVKDSPEAISNEVTHRSVRDFDKDFEALLAESKLDRLVVIIDDLDRCLPSHVIDTLEAIRLFLAVDKTSFVIAADEALIRDAVKDRFPASTQQSRSIERDYLEKMIQVPVRLPLMGRDEVENYINLLVAQHHLPPEDFAVLCGDLFRPVDMLTGSEYSSANPPIRFGLDSVEQRLGPKCTMALKEELGQMANIADVVALSVQGNPRQVKRYLNALFLRLTVARKRGIALSLTLTAKLMLLEYFRPEAFLELGGWQAVQDGMPKEISRLEELVAPRGEIDPAASSQGEDDGATNGDALKGWLEDEWRRAWLRTEPRLGRQALGPYFSLARDRSWSSSMGGRQLGLAGEQVLAKLYDPSDAVRLSARSMAESLPVTIVQQIFAALTERARRSNALPAGGESPYNPIYDLLSWRPEIATEAITFLQSQPVNALRLQTPAKVVASIPRTHQAAARTLLESWAGQSENPGLAEAARQMLANATVWS